MDKIDFTDFLNSEYEMFYRECNFTDRQHDVLELRRKGKSIIQISYLLNMSEATVNREIKKIKKKILKII